MEFRKIQFTGRSSYIVSLPKWWIKKHELKRGDAIALTFNPDGSITIYPGRDFREEPLKKVVEIREDYSPELAVRLAVSAYIQGYDVLEFRFFEGVTLHKVRVRKILQSLPGIEIILDEPGRIVAKSLLDEDDVNLVEFLNRIRAIVVSMLEDLELMDHGDEILKDIYDLERELDRLYFLILRTVTRMLSGGGRALRNPFAPIALLFIATNVERIGDHIVRMAEYHDKRVDPDYLRRAFMGIMKQVSEMNLERVDELMKELGEKSKSIDYNSGPALESFRRVMDYMINIGETIIDLSMSGGFYD